MRQKTGNSISGSMKLDQQRLNSVSDRKQMPVFCVFTRIFFRKMLHFAVVFSREIYEEHNLGQKEKHVSIMHLSVC
jgi:hypothetical protein